MLSPVRPCRIVCRSDLVCICVGNSDISVFINFKVDRCLNSKSVRCSILRKCISSGRKVTKVSNTSGCCCVFDRRTGLLDYIASSYSNTGKIKFINTLKSQCRTCYLITCTKCNFIDIYLDISLVDHGDRIAVRRTALNNFSIYDTERNIFRLLITATKGNLCLSKRIVAIGKILD